MLQPWRSLTECFTGPLGGTGTGPESLEGLAFRGYIEIGCEPPDLYVGALFGRERLTHKTHGAISPQNADGLTGAAVRGVHRADDGFGRLAGQLAAADLHVAGADHGVALLRLERSLYLNLHPQFYP
jgi:hypothetical protein